MGTTRSDYVEKCKQEFQDLQRDGKVLVRYSRNKKGQRTGVVVSYRSLMDNQVYVGVSKCNLSCGDKFNKYVGISKAVSVAVPAVKAPDVLEVPHSMLEVYNKQLHKISAYYKVL